MKNSSYTPPYTITAEIVRMISEISEIIGRLSIEGSVNHVPQLRRSNRIRTIHASLAIENNTLSLEQVTAIIKGKRVLGAPQEIKEVKNAFTVYEKLEQLNPLLQKDLLHAHEMLMESLVSESGNYRSGNVGIIKGKKVVHLAPPAKRVPNLMNDLFAWLKNTDAQPLIASSVFHYEFEFIHPFADGNGRMGRLWQTLILSRWKPFFAYLPVETIIHSDQDNYYKVLAKSDQQADSTLFIEFMLNSIALALKELIETDQVTDQVTDQAKKLLSLLSKNPFSAKELMQKLNLSHRPTFRENYLRPALEDKLIEMTIPEKPKSHLQKYKITLNGKNLLKTI
ncbi:MAG: Fic family protein [Desulfobacteraceae bacterium]|nr:Fic family protein [Desulfobacteraceae bacterium]